LKGKKDVGQRKGRVAEEETEKKLMRRKERNPPHEGKDKGKNQMAKRSFDMTLQDAPEKGESTLIKEGGLSHLTSESGLPGEKERGKPLHSKLHRTGGKGLFSRILRRRNAGHIQRRLRRRKEAGIWLGKNDNDSIAEENRD